MAHEPTIDERELWEFAERTARKVESWPDWKKEGWAVLERREVTMHFSEVYRNGHQPTNDYNGSKKGFD
jgi:hypothetical protein